MSDTLSRPGLPAQPVYSGPDRYVNSVVLHQSTWDFICVKHPEMRGREKNVIDVIQQPDLISEGDRGGRYVLDGYGRIENRSNIVRVILDLNGAEIHLGGGSAEVVTAYAPKTANTGNLGSVIYFSGFEWRTR